MQGLRLKGYLPIKTDAGIASRYAGRPTRSDFPAGLPDLVVLHPSKPAFFVEVKREGGRVSKLQRLVHQMLQDMGYNVYVVIGADEAARFVEAL